MATMIESISAVTLATHDMSRAVHFYRALGFEIVHGGEEAEFTSFRAGTSWPRPWVFQKFNEKLAPLSLLRGACGTLVAGLQPLLTRTPGLRPAFHWPPIARSICAAS
jgi:catechol 2,3-dioxygenase-like lactoylglutathione lyase family enzyme